MLQHNTQGQMPQSPRGRCSSLETPTAFRGLLMPGRQYRIVEERRAVARLCASCLKVFGAQGQQRLTSRRQHDSRAETAPACFWTAGFAAVLRGRDPQQVIVRLGNHFCPTTSSICPETDVGALGGRPRAFLIITSSSASVARRFVENPMLTEKFAPKQLSR